MGKGPEQTLLRGRHTDDPQTYEKMLNITTHQRDANQNHNESRLVWLSRLGNILQSARSPVQFQVGLVQALGFRAHARDNQPINVSLSRWCFSPSLPPSLSLSLKNK